jgi:hypothetical protein
MSANAHLAAVIAADAGLGCNSVNVATGIGADASLGSHGIDVTAGAVVAHTADVYTNVHVGLDLGHDCFHSC